MTEEKDALIFSQKHARYFLRPLTAFDVSFKAKRKSNFPFYITSFFLTESEFDKGKRLQCFEENLKKFLRGYLVAWVKYVEKEKDGTRDISALVSKAMGYLDGVSMETLYEEIVVAQNVGVINVSANNSTIELMKFGSSLGVRVTNKSDHRGGVAPLELMVNEDFGGKTAPVSFFESISSSFALFGETKRDKERTKELTVDFESTLAQLSSYLPDIVWVDNATDMIVSAYKEMKHPGRKIGMLQGMPVYASLIHIYPEGIQSEEYKDKDDAIIYRKGNVSKNSSSVIHFDYGYDLALVLSVKNSLPNPAQKIRDDFDNHFDQERLKNAGAMIHFSLLNMMSNRQMKELAS